MTATLDPGSQSCDALRIRLPTTRTDFLGWIAALTSTAVALWCSRGVLDIVAGAGGAVRVALLPPWWLLAVLVAVFGVLGAAAARAHLDADIVLPLCTLGILALPYLPYLPDRVPVLRALAGPARPLLWLVVCWAVAARGIGRWIVGRWRGPVPLVVFLASAMIFGLAAWRLTDTPLFPSGDEPHYLVITQSLLSDGDLKIQNNHQRGDYRAYFNRPLDPDYLALGADGQIYSIHPVGLPVLAMPAFALGGYRGVVAMLIVIAAAAATLLWRWAREITGSDAAAIFAWAAVAPTAPFLFNSFAVYPEIPAALAVLIAMAWRTESTKVATMSVRGAAIAALPWLSTKYAPMAAGITLVLIARDPRNLRAVAALVAPIAVAFAGWFAFFFWIWGTASPSAPYGASEPTTIRHLAHGGPGLLFDQEYGIVAQAPILMVAFPGLARMLRTGGRDRRRALEIIVIFGTLLVTVGSFHVWWGGSAAPGRPVASAVLLLGVPIASFFASTASRSARAGCHLLLAASVAIACAFAVSNNGALLHNDRDGSAMLLEWASPTWPLWSAFPSFIGTSLAGAIARTLAWVALIAGVAWTIPHVRLRGFGAAALAMLLVGSAGASALASVAAAGMPLTAALTAEGRARVPLLDGFDAARRPVAILYDPLTVVTTAEALARVSLTARPGFRVAPQPIDLLWNARFALPAGEYRVRLTRSAAAAAADTMLALQIGRSGSPLERWLVSGAVWEHRFTLPIDSEVVGFRASADLSRGDGELEIAPLRIVNESRRFVRPPVLGALQLGAATVFFHDDAVFAEATGYWTRGRATAHVTYATTGGAAATIGLVLHCGPAPNQVSVRTRGWAERFALEPGAARTLALPTIEEPALGVRIAPMEISVRDGFVPAQVERSATDRRFLGCWITNRS